MNITTYLMSKYAISMLNISSTEFPSYIRVDNNLVLTNINRCVVINKELDVHGHCIFDEGIKYYVKNVINTMCSLRIEYEKIYPSSYIKDYVYDIKNPEYDDLYINGYVMHNGVLS